MKKLIMLIIGFLILHIAIFRKLWLLNDRMLGIEMSNEDFSRWIHSDLQGIHDHLDKPDEETTAMISIDKGTHFEMTCYTCNKSYESRISNKYSHCPYCGRKVIQGVSIA